jgi:hypothetical protein
MSYLLDEFIERNGYTAAAVAGDGRVLFLCATIFAGQIGLADGLGSGNGVSERWSYETMRDAAFAWRRWERAGFEREPVGWVRHQPSNRRRSYDNGPPFDEWVAP